MLPISCRAVGGALVLAATGLVAACVPLSTPTATSPSSSTVVTTSPAPSESTAPSSPTTASPLDELAATALATLDQLPVKGRAPKSGYSRSQFGKSWSDDVNVEFGHNGCNTRNDILRRDLTDVVFKDGTRDCIVESGRLHDPFSGREMDFVRGADTSPLVQIDHLVSLSDAWQKGAQELTPTQRLELANDPRNLQATDGKVNQAKGDADAASWLPPNRSYRCTYVARQLEVKAAYSLWVTQAEHDVMARVLNGCRDAA